MSVISLKNITAAYGNKDVLMHFNLEIARGEFVMLIGTSGCGKTTALKLMNGLLRPKEGSVVVNGNDLSRTDLTALRRNLGYVVQETGLFPHLTIEKDISYVADLSRKKDSKAIQEQGHAASAAGGAAGGDTQALSGRAFRRAEAASGDCQGAYEFAGNPADGRTLRRGG